MKAAASDRLADVLARVAREVSDPKVEVVRLGAGALRLRTILKREPNALVYIYILTRV